jgi:hypothetical protein
VSRPPDGRPADLEIGGSWRARSARWARTAEVRTRVSGDPNTEEMNERERLPERSDTGRTYHGSARRWHFAAWLPKGREMTEPNTRGRG